MNRCLFGSLTVRPSAVDIPHPASLWLLEFLTSPQSSSSSSSLRRFEVEDLSKPH